jgi:hypothetical protein
MIRRTFTLILIWSSISLAVHGSDKVITQRVPDGGIQPQVVADGKGGVHLIYFKGDAAAGNLFYVKSTDDGKTFSPAIRVNSDDNSAVATGNIRGAHIALGKNGRVHVAWMGSKAAPQKGPKDAPGMLYARLDDSGKKFEPQRNMIQQAYGLDGGGTVSADSAGNVCVLWHGMGEGKGEVNRRVYVVRSADEGKTFSKEAPAFAQNTGACACCGMAALADAKGNVYSLYRSANPDTRDIYLIMSKDKGATFSGGKIAEWQINNCPMSTADLFDSPNGVLATWETKQQVYFLRVNANLQPGTPVAAPGEAKGRKFPVVAESKDDTILVWTEGMSWQKGGSLAWQIFSKDNKVTMDRGTAQGVPEWSLVAVYPRTEGGFTVIY